MTPTGSAATISRWLQTSVSRTGLATIDDLRGTPVLAVESGRVSGPLRPHPESLIAQLAARWARLAFREYTKNAVIERFGKAFRVRAGNVWMPRNLHRRGGHERPTG